MRKIGRYHLGQSGLTVTNDSTVYLQHLKIFLPSNISNYDSRSVSPGSQAHIMYVATYAQLMQGNSSFLIVEPIAAARNQILVFSLLLSNILR